MFTCKALLMHLYNSNKTNCETNYKEKGSSHFIISNAIKAEWSVSTCDLLVTSPMPTKCNSSDTCNVDDMITKPQTFSLSQTLGLIIVHYYSISCTTKRHFSLPVYLRLLPNKAVQKNGTLFMEVFLSAIFNAQIRPKTERQ